MLAHVLDVELQGAAALILVGFQREDEVEARARETTPLNSLCEPQLLTHGARTARVVVLLHGVSSCPQAFVDFAPLLHARRRLEDERELEQRVAAVDAGFLRERLFQILASLAQEVHADPQQAPERRALEAELLDANEPLVDALDSLRDAAELFRQGSEELRFKRWRAWVAAVANVFAAADRSWAAMSGILTSFTRPAGPSR